MNRQAYVFAIVGFVLGSTFVSVMRNSQQKTQMKNATEAVKVTADVAKQYIDGYNNLLEQRTAVFALAQSYEEAKSPAEKAKIADSLVYKIKEFNLLIVK